MKSADEWTRAHTIEHSKSAKKREAERLAAEREEFVAAGGKIQQVEGFTERRPLFNNRDMREYGKRGGKKSGRRSATL